MGYRNDIVIKTSAVGLAKIDHVWNEVGEVPLDDVAVVRHKGNVFTIALEDVRWGGGVPEAEAVEHLLTQGDLDGEPWSFARYGEDPDNHEVLYCTAMTDPDSELEDYQLYVSHYIEDKDGVPVLPNFGLGELALAALYMYDHIAEGDPVAAKTILDSSGIMRELIGERDRQTAEVGGDE